MDQPIVVGGQLGSAAYWQYSAQPALAPGAAASARGSQLQVRFCGKFSPCLGVGGAMPRPSRRQSLEVATACVAPPCRSFLPNVSATSGGPLVRRSSRPRAASAGGRIAPLSPTRPLPGPFPPRAHSRPAPRRQRHRPPWQGTGTLPAATSTKPPRPGSGSARASGPIERALTGRQVRLGVTGIYKLNLGHGREGPRFGLPVSRSRC
jgi:hypothetical protein